jgi:hypothetical protein
MTPKQKAFSLYTEFASRLNDSRIAKKCALIAVDEIIESLNKLFGTIKEVSFYREVKQEINNL